MRKIGFGMGLLLGACLLAAPAQAWTAFGHRLVAELAQAQLSPQAIAATEQLLALEPGASLGSIAAWADEVRKLPAYKDTGPFHYVNFRDGRCRYVAARDCKGGACIVAALDQQLAVLGDQNRSAADRMEALKFVVHLVGDIHQPMHASNRSDSGGNRFQVNLDGKGSNLHSVWDFNLLSSAGLNFDAYRARLAPRVAQTPAGTLDTTLWAEETCALIDSAQVYPARPGTLPAGYLDAHRPLAEARLTLAAARLAAVLEQALVP